MGFFSAQGQAFHRSRETCLASTLAVADSSWPRLRGLLGLVPDDFRNGSGLWIVPCHGVHTLGVGFPIDVVYRDGSMNVIHIQPVLKPWRVAPVRSRAASVLDLPSHTAAQTGTALGDRMEVTLSLKQSGVPA